MYLVHIYILIDNSTYIKRICILFDPISIKSTSINTGSIKKFIYSSLIGSDLDMQVSIPIEGNKLISFANGNCIRNTSPVGLLLKSHDKPPGPNVLRINICNRLL